MVRFFEIIHPYEKHKAFENQCNMLALYGASAIESDLLCTGTKDIES